MPIAESITFERQTVLIVDDMIENIMILDAILHDEYRVRVATSGSQALGMAQREPLPDLILLDDRTYDASLAAAEKQPTWTSIVFVAPSVSTVKVALSPGL